MKAIGLVCVVTLLGWLTALVNGQEAPKQATAKELNRLIEDLDAGGFQTREQARLRLLELGETARAALTEAAEKHADLAIRRRVEVLLRELDIRLLIDQLGAAKFRDRNEATERLLKLGKPAAPALRIAAKKHANLEVRLRAERLLRQLEK